MKLTALVLAGTRAGGDALAQAHGVSHKALIEAGGQTLLQRVIGALGAVHTVQDIIISVEQPQRFANLTDLRARARGKQVRRVAASAGPSASVAAVLAEYGTPLLVTTADHALLRPEWVEDFLRRAPPDADLSVLLAERDVVEQAAPGAQRSYLRFADNDYSACNLFLLSGPGAATVVDFWQEMEALRKKPLKMLSRLGFGVALRYALGRLSLDAACHRLSRRTGARIAPVLTRFGQAAIDVDKPADLELVRGLLAR